MDINICMEIFSKYIGLLYVCVFIYSNTINIYSTHILCKQKLLFWIRLIAINRLTALVLVFINYQLVFLVLLFKLISVSCQGFM